MKKISKTKLPGMNLKKVLWMVVNTFLVSAAIVVVVSFIGAVYFFGYTQGFETANTGAQTQITNLVDQFSAILQNESKLPAPTSEPSQVSVVNQPAPVSNGNPPTWGGPELWEAVNKRRIALGVNSLASRSELCTVASIRLNEQLEAGKIDNHEGFSNLPERRSDLAWVFDKYSISEFLLSGAQSADEAVSLWENTLGHKKLLDGGEYVWGCVYAQAGFAVAITAF